EIARTVKIYSGPLMHSDPLRATNASRSGGSGQDAPPFALRHGVNAPWQKFVRFANVTVGDGPILQIKVSGVAGGGFRGRWFAARTGVRKPGSPALIGADDRRPSNHFLFERRWKIRRSTQVPVS